MKCPRCHNRAIGLLGWFRHSLFQESGRQHACQSCGAQHAKWHGRCPDCGQWDSLVEETYDPPSAPRTPTGKGRGAAGLAARLPATQDEKPRRLSEIDAEASPRIASGEGELDRVLGGGFVPGSVVLLGGDPGIGKSTLALQVAGRLAAEGHSVLYVSGEESAEQIRLRAERLSGLGDSLQVMTSTRVESLADPWKQLAPSFVVIDSIQTIQTDAIESAAGSVAQVRESASQLAATAKKVGSVLLLIGHVTKDGTLAGPRVLEHLVDVVLTFEGDRAHAFRLLRAAADCSARLAISSLPSTWMFRPRIAKPKYRSKPVSLRSRHRFKPLPDCSAPMADSIPGCRWRSRWNSPHRSDRSRRRERRARP